jgi:hypothetical protein
VSKLLFITIINNNYISGFEFMKNLFIIIFISFLLLSSKVHSNDFRGFSWGKPIEFIKNNEKAKLLHETPDALMYGGELDGLSVYIIYKFTDKKFSEGSYINNGSHTNKNFFIDDYKKLKQLLTKKYGKPKEDEIIWGNTIFKDDEKNWGRGVSYGYLTYVASWQSENTNIITSLSGDNSEISHGIIYTDKATEITNKKIEETKTLDKL